MANHNVLWVLKKTASERKKIVQRSKELAANLWWGMRRPNDKLVMAHRKNVTDGVSIF